MSKPTNPNPHWHTPTLTEAQTDGVACVRCGRDLITYSGGSVPVGMAGGGQLFACDACASGRTDVPMCRDFVALVTEVLDHLTTDALLAIISEHGPRAGRLVVAVLESAVDGLIEPFAALSLLQAVRRGELDEVERALDGEAGR